MLPKLFQLDDVEPRCNPSIMPTELNLNLVILQQTAA